MSMIGSGLLATRPAGATVSAQYAERRGGVRQVRSDLYAHLPPVASASLPPVVPPSRSRLAQLLSSLLG